MTPLGFAYNIWFRILARVLSELKAVTVDPSCSIASLQFLNCTLLCSILRSPHVMDLGSGMGFKIVINFLGGVTTVLKA